MNLYKNDVNRKGSASWLLCNDNSRSSWFREQVIQKFGGIFNKNGRYWEWVENIPHTSSIVITTEPPVPALEDSKKTWTFGDEQNKYYTTENLTEFAKEYKLSRQKLYDMMKGERKSHKGFKFVSKSDPENLA
jgi:hypothetical protein